MTDVFDNATSITIGNKEVASIVIDGGTIWEKEVEPPTPSLRTVTLHCGSSYDSQSITLNNVTKTSDSQGHVTFDDVPDGTYVVTTSYDGTPKKATITVDETHTLFERGTTLIWENA